MPRCLARPLPQCRQRPDHFSGPSQARVIRRTALPNPLRQGHNQRPCNARYVRGNVECSAPCSSAQQRFLDFYAEALATPQNLLTTSQPASPQLAKQLGRPRSAPAKGRRRRARDTQPDIRRNQPPPFAVIQRGCCASRSSSRASSDPGRVCDRRSRLTAGRTGQVLRQAFADRKWRWFGVATTHRSRRS